MLHAATHDENHREPEAFEVSHGCYCYGVLIALVVPGERFFLDGEALWATLDESLDGNLPRTSRHESD